MDIKPEKQKLMRSDHWMCRIYKFTYGSEYKGRGFCPLFHASYVALGLLPFTLLGHGFDKGVQIIKDCWPESKVKPDRPKKQKEYWPTEYELNSRYFGDASDINHHFSLYEGVIYRYSDFLKWEESNPNWRVDYEKLLVKREEQRKVAEAREIRLSAKKEKICQYLQYGVKPALIISAVAISYFIWKLAIYLFAFITFENIVSAGTILACLAAVGFVVWGLIKLCARGIDKIDCAPPKVELPDFIYEPAAKVFGFFGHLIEFVKDVISVTWAKKCPLIIWADETKAIEKFKSE